MVNHIFSAKRILVSLTLVKEWKDTLTNVLATQGGGGISPTFGAALWILDYVMQTVIMGTQVESVPSAL